MNLARKILSIVHPKDERERMEIRQALSMASAAAEDITRTVSAPESGLCAQLQGREAPDAVVKFDTFAEICQYRYAPKHSALMRLCKHAEHEAHATKIASCNARQCPLMRKAKK